MDDAKGSVRTQGLICAMSPRTCLDLCVVLFGIHKLCSCVTVAIDAIVYLINGYLLSIFFSEIFIFILFVIVSKPLDYQWASYAKTKVGT